MSQGTPRSRRIALAVVLVVAFAFAAYVAAPLWVGLMFGTVMAFTTQPLYERLARRLGERHALSAAIVTLVSGVACAAIGALALYVITEELVTIVGILQRHATAATLNDMVGPRAARLLEKVGISQQDLIARIHHQVDAAASTIAGVVGVAMATVTNALLGLFLALITMYYVLIEWHGVTNRLEALLPIDPRHTRALIAELRKVGRGALVGTLLTGILQGIFAAIGYSIAGVAQAAVWGTLTAIASFVPLVGTIAVWLPIGVYEIVNGHAVGGIFVLAWGVLVVTSLADYVIRPRIVGTSGHGHPLLMLVALLGGLEAFGLAGLIVGPILMSMFVAVLRIYEREECEAG